MYLSNKVKKVNINFSNKKSRLNMILKHKKFITWNDKIKRVDEGNVTIELVPTIGFGTTGKSTSGFNVKEGQRIPLYVAIWH